MNKIRNVTSKYINCINSIYDKKFEDRYRAIDFSISKVKKVMKKSFLKKFSGR